MKDDLERIEIPDEGPTTERTWRVVERAYAARRPPTPARGHRLRPALAVAVTAAVGIAFVSPPGRAIVGRVREAVGVERATPALFRLPSAGRLLVASDAGIWVVQRDGSRRLLGAYREASWSPFGRYIVASRSNELAALDPDGTVRWSLARPDVRFPRWAGTRTDTRIAYLTRSRLHTVAGDGTRDVAAGALPDAADVAPAWRPGSAFVVTYSDAKGHVLPYDVGHGSTFWKAPPRSAPLTSPRSLEWTSDGRRLLARTSEELVLFGPRSGTPISVRSTQVVASAFRPRRYELAEIRRVGESSQVVVDSRVLFSSAAELEGLTWSPDGRWLLVGSPAADQWVFVRSDGLEVHAVSNVSTQFRTRSFPRVEGWCCSK